MKTKLVLILIALVLFFETCKKDVILLTDEQKSLLLYDLGDKFTLVKNNLDTLNFEVTKKEFSIGEEFSGLFHTGKKCEFANLEYKNKNTISSIFISSSTNIKGVPFEHYFREGYQQVYLYLYKKVTGFTLNNKQYNNVFLLTSDNRDTMYASTDVGILYVKSQDGNEYKLLEQ